MEKKRISRRATTIGGGVCQRRLQGKMMRTILVAFAQFKRLIDPLKERDRDLDQRIRNLNRHIWILENQQINKKELRKVFQEFSEAAAEALLEIKRRLLNVVVEEIRCSVTRGENSGEIVYELRGDGSAKAQWEEALKKKRAQPAPVRLV